MASMTFDDFSDWKLKVAWSLRLVGDLIISNILMLLLIQFDKYGEDSMKRPLHNHLTSQIAYPTIILNTFVTPFWAWRIYYGPLNPTLAELVVLVTASCSGWFMLSLAGALVTRATFMTNSRHAYKIDDKFFSNFIFMVNIGFSVGSNFGLYLLGTCGFGGDQMLSGIKKKTRPNSIFYQVIIGAGIVISIISSLAIIWKKYIEYKKDKNLVKNINVMINNGQESTHPPINNVEYNKPIITKITVQLISVILVSFGFSVFGFTFTNVKNSPSEFTKKIWFAWASNIFLRTIAPIWIIVFHAKGFYLFIIKMYEDTWSNIWNQNNRVIPM